MESFHSSIQDGDHCLALASLFKGNFSIDWLIEITGYKASQIISVLDEGIQQGWLSGQPGGFFIFKEERIQNYWKERLAISEKHSLHQQIASLLAKELPENPKKCEMVAQHLLYAQNDLGCCRLLFSAADHLRKSGQYKVALRYYTKILGDLYEAREQDADRLFIETAFNYARISIAREDTEKIISILQEAIERAKKWNLDGESSSLKMHLAKNEFLQSNYGMAIRHFEDGWGMLKDTGDPKLLQAAAAFQYFSYFWQGRLKKVLSIYEESITAIEKFPLGRHQTLAMGMVGFCYAQTGQFSQGLGMLNALHRHSIEKNDHFLVSDIEVTIAGIMIEMRRADEALSYLQNYDNDDIKENDWNLIRAKLALAFAYFIKGEQKKAVHFFRDWLKRSKKINVNVVTIVFWFEICKAMEEGNFPRLGGIRLENEVQRFIESENILMKGAAYRYKAYLQEKEGHAGESVIESLLLSSKWLKESGHTLAQCRTNMELLRQYTLAGHEKDAHHIETAISTTLGSFSQDYIPSDLRVFIKKIPRNQEFLLDEILNLSQHMSTIREPPQLLQVIISTANQITGAERGAVFRIDEDGPRSQVRLKASKNFTTSQISDQCFTAIKEMVKEVAATCKGRIMKVNSTDSLNRLGKDRILSQICIPMVIRNKVVGVLYHDNNLFINSFKKADLKLLRYFGTQAAIAMDHAEAYEEIRRLNQRLNEEKQYYKEQSKQNIQFEDIIGESPGILEVLEKIDKVAKAETAVLILGETGVGKDLVARAIHRHSSRTSHPFIKVLCNALPESLIASELFGHEKGAFTGSIEQRIGRFELADGGTIFLDEIGDLQLDIQTRLLQILQSKEFERVGGAKTIRSDFRLVTATNRDLAQAVKSKTFRSDLYYRLNVFPIFVPPLRERKEDIPLLAYHFLNIFSKRMGKKFDGISKAEMKKLMQYNWPGNIRELEGIIERGMVLSSDSHFRIPELGAEQLECSVSKSDATLAENERLHILQTLEKTGWKVRGHGGAAESLSINYSTLFYRMKKLGIKRPPHLRKGRKKADPKPSLIESGGKDHSVK